MFADTPKYIASHLEEANRILANEIGIYFETYGSLAS